MEKKFRLAVLASGDGSTFERLVDAARNENLSFEIAGLICNKREAGVLRRADRLGVPVFVCLKSECKDVSGWNSKMAHQLKSWSIDGVVLAGYTALVGEEILGEFPDRTVNIHPSLLPKFGGRGMYGLRVHQAVLAAAEKETGMTIHLVNQNYDDGRVLRQERLAVEPEDTPETLAARVQQLEKKFYPLVIEEWVQSFSRNP